MIYGCGSVAYIIDYLVAGLDSAARLQRWHDDGQLGPRPRGRLAGIDQRLKNEPAIARAGRISVSGNVCSASLLGRSLAPGFRRVFGRRGLFNRFSGLAGVENR